MFININLLLGATELGLIYAIMALGVYLTFRTLDFPDLTVDGSFTLGAAASAVLIAGGHSPWLGLLLAPVAGILAGLVTGLLHTRFKITPLLAGILTMTALYSVNLRVMGKANVPLLGLPSIYDTLTRGGLSEKYAVLAFGAGSVALLVFFLYWLFQTELGLALRATGDNETMIKSLGINGNSMKLLGLGLGNGLVALAGAAIAQFQGFADMSMGIGMIIAGLASVIIGEVLLGSRSLLRVLIAVVGGSVAYRVIIAIVLRLGFQATDMKMLTAALVVLALTVPRFKSKQQYDSLRR
ncbi:MAG: ABC transporter permease [Peptococcia bacterium]